jgi:hypothetical protein
VFTICIARAMGLSREHINPIARGASLPCRREDGDPRPHSPKARPLTPDETEIMRQHCIRRYELVHKIPFLADAAGIVYSHHERYDGARDPRGLPSRQIPLGARIVSVANTPDSITSELYYRPARTFQAHLRKSAWERDASSILKSLKYFFPCQTTYGRT